MTTMVTKQRYHVKGTAFGARQCSSTGAGSCTCDPCDCNPCRCGDGVNIPHWRVSGYQVQRGACQGIALSDLLLLSLAQPVEAGKNERWQEVILVDERATPEQVTALLEVFEERLESMPAEVEPQPVARRAVYRTAIQYSSEQGAGLLRVHFTPGPLNLVRKGTYSRHALSDWSYSGPMALRGDFDLRG